MNNNFSQAEKTLAFARNGESLGRTALHINHNDQPITVKTEMAYSNNFSMSGGGVMQPQSMSQSSENTTLVSLEAEPSLDEIAVARRKDNEEPIVSHRLSTSPVQRLIQELLPSGNDQSTHNVSMQQNWYKKSVGIDSDQFGSPLQSVASGGYPIEAVIKIKSHFLEMISPGGGNMSDLRSLKQLKDLQTEADGASSIEEVSFGGRKVSFPYARFHISEQKASLRNQRRMTTKKSRTSTSKSDASGILCNYNQQEPCHSESILSAQEMKESHHRKRKGDGLEDPKTLATERELSVEKMERTGRR